MSNQSPNQLSNQLGNQSRNQSRWVTSGYARQYFACESVFLDSALKQAASPLALQVGSLIDSSVVDQLDLPFLMRADCDANPGVDLVADPAFLPFFENSLSMVILPHALEGHDLPHQVLREAHRVLMFDGHLVLTGFNPLSLLGLQRLTYGRAVFAGRYYMPGRVIDWLQLLGFEVVASAMFQYAPLSKRERVQKTFNFLESVGNRWLPMFGGGYMIAARKRDAGMTPIGRTKFRTPKRKLVATAAAKNVIKTK